MSATCRFCQSPLTRSFVDLGMSPLANALISQEQRSQAELFYPLHAYLCDHCLLVQLSEFASPQTIFSDYSYFSSYSDSWMRQCKAFSEKITHELNLQADDLVVEIASNDGYLLKYFQAQGIRVLGVEPAANVAQTAIDAGIPTLAEFFTPALAQDLVTQGHRPKLITANNVLAHVPDINAFVSALKILLPQDGLISIEFPHLLNLMLERQFDTIYHEHFSYFSLASAERILRHHGLAIIKVDTLPSHGGSLRLFVRHGGAPEDKPHESVKQIIDNERQHGLHDSAGYAQFSAEARKIKNALLSFLITAKEKGQNIVGYGAPAKGNTLLNYCGIRNDFLDYTVDRSPHKQGKFLPGTHIPVFAVEKIEQTKPDYVLILPWNLKDEIIDQLAGIRAWGGRFVIAIPQLEIIP